MGCRVVICVLLLLCVAVRADIAPTTRPAERAAALRKIVEQTAHDLPWLDSSFIYDRAPSFGPDTDRVGALYKQLREPAVSDVPGAAGDTELRWGGPYPIAPPGTSWRDRAALEPGAWSAEEIRPLLSHADPKVRTLAVVLMYQLNRVDVLPDLAELAYDEAETFPEPENLTGSDWPLQQRPWPMRPRKVRDFVAEVLKAYTLASTELRDMAMSGRQFPHPDDPKVLRQTLKDFAERRHPTRCTAAMVIAMRRAQGGSSPMVDARRPRVAWVVSLLPEIEMPRRFFVALRLQHELNDRSTPADAQLLSLARQVPREIRLGTFGPKPALVDPDLGVGFGYDFLGAHATDLFRESDADWFLALERSERERLAKDSIVDHVASYAIIAARIRSRDADAILAGAMERITENDSPFHSARERVACAMAEIGGEASMKRAMDWFFTTKPYPGAYGAGREQVLAVLSKDPVRARKFHEMLIRDPRLTTLGPATTRTLVESASGYLGRPLADETEIRASYGIDEAQRDRKFAHLAKWHAALVQTVDEWSK